MVDYLFKIDFNYLACGAFFLKQTQASRGEIMKYTNTSKVLSLIGHALLFCAFGALGILYGCFVVPFYFNDAASGVDTSIIQLPSLGFAAVIQLAVVGFSIATIAGYGIYHAIKSILKGTDEEAVKSFSCLISIGYLAAIYIFSLACMFFDLFSNGNYAFFIIMAILITVILMIATNIPMVKIFERRDAKPLYGILAASAGAVGFYVFLFAMLGLVGSLSYGQPYNGGSIINTHLVVLAITWILIAALCALGAFGAFKPEHKLAKGSGLFLTGAGILVGGYILFQGIFSLVTSDKDHVSFLNEKRQFINNNFGIMSIVVGSIVLILVIVVFMVINRRKALPKEENN